MKWRYGNKWERHPIERGEIWKCGINKIMCADIIRDDLLRLFENESIDLIYVDPPWNTGNINSFRTKAGYVDRDDFKIFIDKLLTIIKTYAPRLSYIEMGKQNADLLISLIKNMDGRVTDVWDTVYYRKFPAKLIRMTFLPDLITSSPVDLNGMDDEHIPGMVISSEQDVHTVCDLCAGKGLTGREAHKSGKRFIGSELSERRIAWLIEFYANQGLEIQVA